MELKNSTVKPEFFLLGFSDHPELQIVLFAVFFSIYSVTLMGNLGMILLITISSHLHIPITDHSLDMDKVTSLFYTLIIPMLNPLIYSLRNKDVKNAFRKVISQKLLS
ncbi:hypothetical protein HPG69_019040 [Diceros bicornis minor]|uniref:Uncharacterized protein n=1 Tax=Diceros bicornis minor TaxID=77932 RepID=A0A7J7FHD6_DICBM|nr:hypothetical protein HPG69_019040 [Diceros bicornis minor]